MVLRKFPVAAFCLITLSITWGLKYAYALVNIEPGTPSFNFSLIASWGPSLAALLLVGVTEGASGFRKIWHSLIRWRVGTRWLCMAAFFEPVLFGLITLAYVIRSGGLPDLSGGSTLPVAIASLFIAFLFGLIRWGVAEEIGWRGWMFPHLMSRMSPFRATMVLAGMTALWHIHPNSLSSIGTVQDGTALIGRYPEIVERLIITIPIDLVTTYIYLKTKGSLLPMVVFHSASNASYFWLDEYFGVVTGDLFRTGFLISMPLIFVVFTLLVLKETAGSSASAETPENHGFLKR
jgi:membrane protease YdiL (CAAX protease family)